jgi:pyruvate/2-oxoacid:ferredoxin oxidoreductase alpha subunit
MWLVLYLLSFGLHRRERALFYSEPGLLQRLRNLFQGMPGEGNRVDQRGTLMADARGVGGVKILDGNRAAAYGILLSRPDMITSYPITPQTPLLETLYRFQADGLLDAELVETEGENTSMSILLGASAAGGRTFTATSSQGLSFMNDAYLQAAGNRFPIVMVIGMREQVTPHGVVTGQQDAVSVKDHGWIQLFTESSQEILDSIIMAYRLAEDEEILLPVNVCYEGFYLSHHSQRVEVPEQKDVDEFLAPLKTMKRQKFTLEEPTIFSSYTAPGELYTEYRFKACAAQQRAKAKFDQIDKEFGEKFGRYYGGQIEEYKTEDAEVVIVTMGCSTGTSKVVIDKKRDEGLKVGLVKIRMFRPSPKERLINALNGKKVIGVIDRNVCFGWNCGHNFLELKTLLSDLEIPLPLLLDFIGGLGGCDITSKDVERVINRTIAAAQGEPQQTVTWLSLE